MSRHRLPGILFLLTILALFVRPGAAEGPPVAISEVLVGNASTNIDPTYTNYSSWIELHNTTGAAINLTGYTLSSLRDGRATPDRYTLPSGAGSTIPAGGRVLVWYDEIGSGLHTPFELDMDGGVIELLAPNGGLVDSVTLAAQKPDLSYGRASGGGWAYFDPPTPGAANNTPAFASYVN
ncbi:lamin tail domain-containing protein, partial [Promineifilum sp.]|uniref:lamin tail domain-containing protein n=1 Tax=Promineifilum sp. TaxID=2664178 RepID=UPI0035B1165A